MVFKPSLKFVLNAVIGVVIDFSFYDNTFLNCVLFLTKVKRQIMEESLAKEQSWLLDLEYRRPSAELLKRIR